MGLVSNYIKTLGRYAENEIEKNVYQMLPKGNLNYVDCGCDSGEKTLLRARQIDTQKVVGIESVPARAKKAKENGIKVLQFDLNSKWKLKSTSIDVITATEVIEHLVDLDIFFSEARRVLKKHGRIIISTENLASWHNIFALIIGNQPFTGPFLSRYFAVSPRPYGKFFKDKVPMNPHLNVMTLRALLKLLEAYGFQVTEYHGIAFYPFFPPLSNFFSLLDKYHSSYMVVSAQKK